MSFNQANGWLEKFSLAYGFEAVPEPALLNEREGQRVYRVETLAGEAYTVRLCPESRPYARVMADAGILFYLKEANFPAPALTQTRQNQLLFEWGPGAWGYTHKFLAGENPEYNLEILQELAAMLAHLHSLYSDRQPYPVEVFWLEDLKRAAIQAENCRAVPEWGTLAAEVADNLRSLPELKGLPKGLIHTDIHEGNLLVDPDGRLYLLDWEDAGQGELVLDLALVIGWNCIWPASKDLQGRVVRYDFDEEWCKTFLGVYQQQRPLSSLEATHLGSAIRFVMGWFAARDIEREAGDPGVSDGLAFTNWAIMRSVTPEWERTLEQWVKETSPAYSGPA